MMYGHRQTGPLLGLRGLLLGLLLFGSAVAQDQPPRRTGPPARELPSQQALMDMRRRLVELDRLLALESVGRAESLLKSLEQHSLLGRELVPRRIKLYQLQDRHEEAVELCRDALRQEMRNPGLWRSLSSSLLALDRPLAARGALGNFLAASPDARSSGTVAVDLLRGADQDSLAVTLIDSLRIAFDDGHYLGRPRALSLLGAGRQAEAAAEISRELRSNPFNLELIRVELLEGPYRADRHEAFRQHLLDFSAQTAARTSERLLVANLALGLGDSEQALRLARTKLSARPDALAVLQNGVTLSREIPLLDDGPELQATVDYLLAVLAELTTSPVLDRALQQRSADFLAKVCQDALLREVLGPDPELAVERFGELLDLVRQINPTSEYLYSSQVKLAVFTRDQLGEPLQAARRLEHLLLDLDLPSEGLALVRLTLGECYFAVGDTARGRTVLTRLGRSIEFREAAGHAHYHLARLDLAEGHFGTARDRFAVVALENPAAPYANDALEMGLAIAEEMENPSGGPHVLARYARSVYFGLTAQPDSQLAVLEDFVTYCDRSLDLEAKQHLLERARFELGELYLAAGRLDDTLATWTEVTVKHPAGRFPAEALARRGQLLQELGRQAEAEQVWQQLLAQYPDYLFIADVRDRLRHLP